MVKTGKPIAAGILDIIAGSLSLIGILFFLFVLLLITPVGSTVGDTWVFDGYTGFPFNFGWLVLIIFWIPGLIIGALSIVGGIFALKRKRWGWALAGSIAVILTSFIFGIIATILISLSRDEFE